MCGTLIDEVPSLLTLHQRMIPSDSQAQQQYIGNMIETLSKKLPDSSFCDELDMCDRYHLLIHHRVLEVRRREGEFCKAMELYACLYHRLEQEHTDSWNLMVSMLQPPPALFQCANSMLSMKPVVLDYVERLKAIPVKGLSSMLTEQELLSHQALCHLPMQRLSIVQQMKCEVEEFCELVWRYHTDTVAGEMTVTQSYIKLYCKHS